MSVASLRRLAAGSVGAGAGSASGLTWAGFLNSPQRWTGIVGTCYSFGVAIRQRREQRGGEMSLREKQRGARQRLECVELAPAFGGAGSGGSGRAWRKSAGNPDALQTLRAIFDP